MSPRFLQPAAKRWHRLLGSALLRAGLHILSLRQRPAATNRNFRRKTWWHWEAAKLETLLLGSPRWWFHQSLCYIHTKLINACMPSFGACICIRMHIHLFIDMNMYIYIYLHVYAYLHLCTYVYTTHIHMHIQIHVHIQTHIRLHRYICIHT